MTFQVDDLVVKTGENEVMRVVEVDEGADFDILCAIGNDDDSAWFESQHLSLASTVEDVTVEEENIYVPQPVYTSIATEVLHDEINKLFIEVSRYLHNERGVDKRARLSIEAESYNSSDDLDVKYIVNLGYGDVTVESDNLMTSVRLAANRHEEDKQIKPKAIAHYA